jgi:hypothetical protein
MVATEDTEFKLSFSPTASLIRAVRRFVSEFYSPILANAEVTSRLVIATHEILENILHYSLDGQAQLRIGVSRSIDELHLSMETRSTANEAHRASLVERLAEMRKAPNRNEFWLGIIQRTKHAAGSGLGLARIFAESGLDLSCEIEGDAVILRAERRFPLEGGSP